MRSILRGFVPCAIVALSASCDSSSPVAPSLSADAPFGINGPGSPFAGVLSGEPGVCAKDSKLLNGGPTSVFGEGDGTWWGLVINGLKAAGFVTDAQETAYLNQVFGTSYGSLNQLEVYNLNLVENNWDLNQNGYVCAYELRGTRAHFDDPFINLTFFGISDDKLKKN